MSKLTKTQKNFRRNIGNIYGKKKRPKRPFLKRWMVLIAIIIAYLIIQNTGRAGDMYTVYKHNKVKTYMNEVYNEYVSTANMLNDLVNGKDPLTIPLNDLYAVQDEILKLERIINVADVPKKFKPYHAALSDTFFYYQKNIDLLFDISTKNSYGPQDQQQLLLLSQHIKSHNQMARELLEKSFKDSKMEFVSFDDGSFKYYYFKDAYDAFEK